MRIRGTVKVAARVGLAGFFEGSGALWLLSRAERAFRGPRIHVLGFHRVVDDLAALGPDVNPALCVSTGSFARICALAAERYTLVTVEEAAVLLAERRSPPRDLVVLTFDDAYRDVALRALPILRRYHLPATVFVPLGYVGSSRPLLHDRLYGLLYRARQKRRPLHAAPTPRLLRPSLMRAGSLLQERAVTHAEAVAAALDQLVNSLPTQALCRIADGIEDLLGGGVDLDEGGRVMSAAELRACAEAGLEVGAHTIDHRILTVEPRERVRRELERPRRELAEICGRPCQSFAYCNGMYSPALVAAVEAAGYRAAVTTEDRVNRAGTDPLLIGRKVLAEASLCGLRGAPSPSLAAAQLHDLFGALRSFGGLGRRSYVEGAHDSARVVGSWLGST